MKGGLEQLREQMAEYLTACCPDVRFAVGCGGDALCFTGGCRG